MKLRVKRAANAVLVRPTRCVCAGGGAGADNRSCQREHQHDIDALHHCPCVREKQGPTLQVKRRLLDEEVLVFAHFCRSSFDHSLHTAGVKAEARPMVPCWRRALDATLWLALIISLTRHVHAGCADTPDYRDRHGVGCSTYMAMKWCQGGDIGANGCK